jgi:preprotein translocase SecF subunit
MAFRLRLAPDNLNVNWFRFGFVTFGISAVLVAISIGLFAFKGLSYGIDFRGGTLIMVETEGSADIGAFRSVLGGLDLGEVAVTGVSSATGTLDNTVLIRIEQHADGPEAQQAKVDRARAALDGAFAGLKYLQVDTVGAKVSGELLRSGLMALGLSMLGVAAYVWLRFEWQFSVGAMAALFHDVLLTIGLYSLLEMQFNLTTIAALLTLVGYSLNDTIVIFDRVRENLRKFKTRPLVEVMNLSINETMGRTLITAMTTLLAMFALYFLGGETIHSFMFAMLFGVFVGTYSTIFVATVILLWLGVKRDWDRPEKGAAGTQYAGGEV